MRDEQASAEVKELSRQQRCKQPDDRLEAGPSPLPPVAGDPVIVVAGEVLIDLTSVGEGQRYVAHPGGGPANVAVALARLGTSTFFLGRLSVDGWGNYLTDWLTDNGVDLTLSQRCQERTSLAVASIGPSGDASYDFYWEGTSNSSWSEQDLPSALPPGTQAIHLGSLATVLEPSAGLFERLLSAAPAQVTRFLDPNVRPQFETPAGAASRIARLIELSDVLKVSTEDLSFAYPASDPWMVASAWAEHNNLLVLLTDGSRGAHVFARGVRLSVQAPAVDVVDTIGAGDTFGAAFLAALGRQGRLRRGAARSAAELQLALEFACSVAAVTCSRAGADSPRLAELAPGVALRLTPSPAGSAEPVREL